MEILMKRIKRIQGIVNAVKTNNDELESLKKRFKDASSSDVEKSKNSKDLVHWKVKGECGSVCTSNGLIDALFQGAFLQKWQESQCSLRPSLLRTRKRQMKSKG